MTDRTSLMAMTTEIVAAYVQSHELEASELPGLIEAVHVCLLQLSRSSDTAIDKSAPAIAIKKSITSDFIVCLEDGRRFKSLKRHLRTRYNMTPDEYRAKWGLPPDYPMVAPSYAQVRSKLAKSMGLGQAQVRKDGDGEQT